VSIDNRVVHLGFDNAQFEAGVSKSMSTLDKLKAKLDFKKESTGLTGLQSALNNVDFSAMARGIEYLEYRFSAMGIAGMNVVNKITNSLINGAKHLEQATIGQIKTGGWNRAMNLANAQFTIEGLKLDWDEMLKSINYGVQDTAYGLDSAAKAASSLAASGVDYKESIDGANDSLMHTSLRAISGVAAMTNSSYDDIAHVFTTVAGQGRLMSEQLNSLAARGMNAAATLGEQLGKTEAEVRDMVSKGQIDFEMFATAMDDAFGEHAKEANKTFTGALSNMKAALSRIGAIFATPVINKTNTFFIALTGKIKEVQKALNDTTDESGNKVIRFAGHFAEAWETGVNVISELIDKLDLSWFNTIASQLDNLAVKTRNFFNDLRFLISGYHDDTKEGAEETSKTLSVTAKEAEAAKKVIGGMYGNGAVRKNALEKEFGAESAKRIQDYVDSVVAAGYNYEKATIKISESSEEASGGIADMVKKSKEQRKIKFHAIINQLSAAFANLGRAGKNVLTNISKIGGAIVTAFKSVFGIKDGAYDGVAGITKFMVKLADFTEKLIISEDTVKKITEKFTSFFTVIKNGLTFVVDLAKYIGGLVSKFIKARVEIASLPQAAQDVMEKAGVGTRIFGVFQTLPSFIITIKEKVEKAFQSFKEIKIPFVGNVGDIIESIKSGEAWKKIKAFGSSVWSVLDESFGSVDWSDKISGLFNFLIKTIMGINWGDAGKIAGVSFVVKTLVDIFFKFKDLGNIVASITALPKKIGSFFSEAGTMFNKAGKAIGKAATAYTFWTIAKSIALVAGTLIALANVDQDKLYSAAAVLVVIALVLSKLAKLVDIMTNQSDEQSSIKTSIKTLASSIKLIYSMAVLIAAIGVAVALMATGLAVIKKFDVGIKDLLILTGVLTVLVVSILGIVEVIKMLPETKNGIKGAGSLAAVALVIFAIASAMTSVAIALKVMEGMSTDGLIGALSVLFSLIAGIAVIIGLSALLAQYKPAAILAIAVVIAAVGFALSSIILSVAAAMNIMALASNISNGDADSILLPIFGFLGIVSIVILALIALIAVATKTAEQGDTGEIVGIMLSMTALIGSLAAAILLIGVALKLMENLKADQMISITTMMAVVLGGIALLTREFSNADPKQLLSGAVTVAAVGASMLLLAMAIKKLARISFASTGLLVAIGVISLVILMFSRMTALKKAAGDLSDLSSSMRDIKTTLAYVVAGILAFAVSMLIVAKAFEVMDGLKDVGQSALAMVGVLVVIAGVVALLTVIASKSFNSGDALLSVGAAFIMIAGAMLIFAFAVERMSSSNADLLGIVIVFGVLAAIMAVLAAIAAKFPKFGEAMITIGKAFLYAGIGAVLVGAGIWLVCDALKSLMPVIPALIIDANLFFTMLEDHYPVLIIITIIVVALTVAIVALGATVGPIIKSVAEVIASGAQVVLNLLDSLATGAKNFVSGLSTKGKAAIAGLITALCGALTKASPEVFKTIGNLIIKVLGYLGSIIGTIASALLEFIINLINGLAEAIRSHSNRVAASIFNLLYALIDVVLAVLKEIVNIIFGNMFGGKVADLLGDFLDYGQESLDAHAAKMLADAEAADAAKASLSGYNKELEKQAKAIADSETGGSSTGSSYSTGGGGGFLGGASEIKEKLGIGNFVDMDSIEGFDISKSINMEGAGANEFQKYMSNLGGDQSYATGYDTASMFDEGASDYFDTEGYDSAEGTGTTYTTTIADSMTSDQSIEEVKSATTDVTDAIDEELDTYHTTLTTTTIPKAMHGVYSAMVVNSSETTKGAKFIVDGILRAINSGMDSIYNAGAIVGDGLHAGFVGPRGIDANSPSKKFYQGGLYCVMGVEEAIKDNSYLATDAMTDLSSQMIDSFGNPLDYISKVASGEIAYDPTIRPVMDMSDAYRASLDVNSMFRNQSISLSGLSGQIAYDMTNLNGSNAAVVSEIQALREDMDFMTDELTNMQIVMDTGALVGSTVGAYDQALGSRQVYSKRGTI
jgi:tape measure domain-containing protein